MTDDMTDCRTDDLTDAMTDAMTDDMTDCKTGDMTDDMTDCKTGDMTDEMPTRFVKNVSSISTFRYELHIQTNYTIQKCLN